MPKISYVPKYKCDGITLYHGDCLKIVPTLTETIDAVVADPPYGMNANLNSKRFSGFTRGQQGPGINNWEEIKGDNKPFDPSLWTYYPKVCLWGSNHFSQKLTTGTTLVWIKKPPKSFGTFLSDAEIGWMKGGHGVYCYFQHLNISTRIHKSVKGERPSHPMEKPVELMKWVMDRMKIPTGATVLDPYMGSGTIAIACIETGRKCIGIEINKTYFETALLRVKDKHGAGTLKSLYREINKQKRKRQ